MNEPAPPVSTPAATPDGPPSPGPGGPERRSPKLSPKLVLLLLIGSCSAFGYTIYRLLQGMKQ